VNVQSNIIDNAFEKKLIKGQLTDLDMGQVMTSLTVQSGKRIFSVVMPTSEVKPMGLVNGCIVYCVVDGKDVIIIRDIKEYMTRLAKKNEGIETYLVK